VQAGLSPYAQKDAFTEFMETRRARFGFEDNPSRYGCCGTYVGSEISLCTRLVACLIKPSELTALEKLKQQFLIANSSEFVS
jgi:hypothetical protein